MPETLTEKLPDVPGFTIHRLLAHGGTAEVYLARQESLGRDVALKLLSPQQSDDSFTERFLKEGRLIASLRHPNIITIYDIGVLDDGRHYISMEYLEGGDLEKQLNGKSLPELQAVVILREMAECLRFVHEQGIIHRDIKPGNILFRKNGSLVLTDFGIAKLMEDDVKLTQTGATIGSPAYSSPQQAQGLDLDLRTDIYSLGVVFLEMLLGYNPYKSETFATTSINHIQMPVPQLEGKLKQYQPLINQMLAKSPDERFKNTEEILAYLDNPPRQFWNPFARFGDIDKTVLRGGAALLVVILLSGVFIWQFQKTNKALSELLHLASARMEEGKWFEPAGDSAQYYFQQVLEQDRDNSAARQGIDDIIQKLLSKAESAIAKKRLMKPVKANAYYFYQQILKIDANQKAALEGIEKLVGIYVKLGDDALADDRLMLPKNNSAYYYYTQAMRIDSNNIAANQGLRNLIERYLELADQAKRSHKLLTPRGSSAIDYYKRVLEIDPRNTDAKRGIEGLANHYAKLARGARDRGEREKMLLYISRGLSIDPYNTALISLQAEETQQSKGNFFQRIFK